MDDSRLRLLRLVKSAQLSVADRIGERSPLLAETGAFWIEPVFAVILRKGAFLGAYKIGVATSYLVTQPW